MNWERSSWKGYDPPVEDRFRYALIVPRLLAPHPNRGAGKALRPDQGLALAVQVRLRNLRDYAKDLESVPKFSEWEQSADWGWRFVGSFVKRLLDETPELLLSLADEAPSPSSRAAASVAAACGLLDFGRIDEALDLIEDALAAEGYQVVDHAWLEAQRARFCHEVGHHDEALATAKRVRDHLTKVEGDATADAIDATAASLILSITLRDAPESFEEALIAGDTVAAWWRTQTISSGNEAAVKRTFEHWSRDRRITVGGEDIANNRLLSAALLASHSGDQVGWANRTAELGRDQLLRLDRHADPEEGSAGLGSLRLGGDSKSLQLAISHLAEDGPAQAVATAASSVNLTRSTRTTALADLTVLQRGGDLLDAATADHAVFWLLATLADPTAFARRTTPTFLLELQLVETLVGVIAAAGRPAQETAIERLLEMPAEQEQLIAQQWANLLWSLPADAWSEATARGAAHEASRHHLVLKRALLGIAARRGGHDEARARLTEEAIEGSIGALGELGSVAELPSELAGEVIAGLVGPVRKRIEEAKGNRISFGVRDPAEALVVMNLWHHDVARWDPLVELLGTDAVPASLKLRTLGVLASNSDSIPASVVDRLHPIVSGLSEKSHQPRSPFEPQGDIRGPAVDLGLSIGAVDPERATEILLAWLAGDADERRWAVHIAYRLRRCEDTGLLTALAQDRDPGVRADAAAALATILPPSAGEDSATAQALTASARDPGSAVPKGIAAVLAGTDRLSGIGERILRELGDHISATVRSLADDEPNSESIGKSELEADANPFLRRFRYETEKSESDEQEELEI